MKDDYNYITMIERATDIMDLIFTTNRELGVSEISHELSLPKATVYRILITLAKGGFISKGHETEKYTLGGKFIKYSDRVKRDINVYTIAKPYMGQLADKVGETVNLAIDYDNQSLIIDRENGEQTSLLSKLVSDAPYNCSSSGKIFLSHKSDDEIRDYFNKGHAKQRTIKSITSIEDFSHQRKDILEKGYAIDDEEYDYGLYCIGRPVFTHSKKLMAVISLSGPKSRLEHKGFQFIIDSLSETVNVIQNKINKLEINE
ncbi:MAG: IclR family transcriptional regulator [Eubacteriales bacterium]|nr:IclR family transcriptional regulator [Eubacteriales bacterium]